MTAPRILGPAAAILLLTGCTDADRAQATAALHRILDAAAEAARDQAETEAATLAEPPAE